MNYKLLFIRFILVVAYLGLLFFSFLSGKGHTLIIDNRNSADGSVLAIDGVLVSIDGSEVLELYGGDRDMLKVKGQTLLVKMEIPGTGQKIEKRISVPLMEEMLLLSVPKLLSGAEPSVEVFIPLDTAPAADEGIGNVNSYTSPDALPVF